MRREIIDGVDRPTMKAIVRDTYGSAGVLELRDIDKPEIADDEVLVAFTRPASIRAFGTS
jgi:hypothetical protein